MNSKDKADFADVNRDSIKNHQRCSFNNSLIETQNEYEAIKTGSIRCCT